MGQCYKRIAVITCLYLTYPKTLDYGAKVLLLTNSLAYNAGASTTATKVLRRRRQDNERGMLKRRYYRQHCTLDFGSYTKDLSAICPDLASVFILDNSPGAYRAYPGLKCSLLIHPWSAARAQTLEHCDCRCYCRANLTL